MMKQHWRYLVGAALLIAVVGCGPEDGRVRGQLGADVNNKVIVGNTNVVAGQTAPIQPNSKVWSNGKP